MDFDRITLGAASWIDPSFSSRGSVTPLVWPTEEGVALASGG